MDLPTQNVTHLNESSHIERRDAQVNSDQALRVYKAFVVFALC
jgi:hypothetical protein